MATTNKDYNNFSGGEISPEMLGRYDTAYYQQGCKQLKNWNVLETGGVKNRSGFERMGQSLSTTARLVRYIINETQRYALVFTPLKIRIYKLGGTGELESLGSPIEITTPYSDPWELWFTQKGALMVITHPDLLPRTLEMDINDETSWTLGALPFYDGPYDEENKDTSVTITMSGTLSIGGTVTLTASSAIFADTDTSGSGGSGSYDRWFRITDTTKTYVAFGQITAFTSTTVVTLTVSLFTTGATAGSFSACDLWTLGAFSTTSGFPAVTTFHEQRLYFATTTNEPQALWGSKLNDFYKYSPTKIGENVAGEALLVTDSESFKGTISASDSARITFLISSKTLFIGTSAGPYAVSLDGISPLGTSITLQNNTGAAEGVTPQLLGGNVIYASDDKRKLIGLGYAYETEAYIAQDLTITANHIFKQGVCKQLAATTSNNILYILTEDGRLYQYVYNTLHKVFAFSEIIMGGTYKNTSEVYSVGIIEDNVTYEIADNSGGADFTIIGAPDNVIGTRFTADSGNPVWGTGSLYRIRSPKVLSITTLGDRLYAVVQRETETSVELLSEYPVITHPYDRVFKFLDAHKFYTGAATTSFTGATHLANQTCTVFADGYTVEDVAVDGSGNFTLSDAASNVAIGYTYTHTLETTPFVYPGSKLGRGKHFTATLQLYNTMFLLANDDDVSLKQYADYMGVGQSLYTGAVKQSLKASYDRDPTLTISLNKPVAATVLSIESIVAKDM